MMPAGDRLALKGIAFEGSRTLVPSQYIVIIELSKIVSCYLSVYLVEYTLYQGQGCMCLVEFSSEALCDVKLLPFSWMEAGEIR